MRKHRNDQVNDRTKDGAEYAYANLANEFRILVDELSSARKEISHLSKIVSIDRDLTKWERAREVFFLWTDSLLGRLFDL